MNPQRLARCPILVICRKNWNEAAWVKEFILTCCLSTAVHDTWVLLVLKRLSRPMPLIFIRHKRRKRLLAIKAMKHTVPSPRANSIRVSCPCGATPENGLTCTIAGRRRCRTYTRATGYGTKQIALTIEEYRTVPFSMRRKSSHHR